MWADGICAVEAVAGHHDGLIGMSQMQDGLEEMLSSDDWDDCPSGKMPSLHGQEEFMQAEEAFAQDFPDFHMQRIQGKRSRVQGRLEGYAGHPDALFVLGGRRLLRVSFG